MHSQEVKGPTVVCSAFIEKDGKFLLVLDPAFKVWRVPGGRTEWTEKVEDTLVREMKEETGIDVTNPRFLGYGQDNQYHYEKQNETSRFLLFFHVKVNQEPVLDPEEAEDHQWVTLEEMKKIENKEGALTQFLAKNINFQ